MENADHVKERESPSGDNHSREKVVAVFGAGVAGLTVAHELSRRGFKVRVYEANENAGGFFRSARRPEHHGMPSEYSWHGIAPWYHNVFDIMKQIPFDAESSVYEKSLSRPIEYGIASNKIDASFTERGIFGMIARFRFTLWDRVRWGWLLLKTWSSHRRTLEHYSHINASEAWKPILSPLGWRTWRATFGPWIGSDWTRVSLHHVGLFFRYNLMPGRRYHHPADSEGPAWRHGPGKGWLLLRGPSNEFWFDKWVKDLQAREVEFHWNQSLHKFEYDGDSIVAAYLESGEEIRADVYVLAVNPFAAADILQRSPDLANQDQLRLFQPLISDGPHTQVSFRIAFSHEVKWTRKRNAFVLADSEFNLTIFPEEQVWDPSVSLGEGVVSLWTGTACAGMVPGRLYGQPVVRCTEEQFKEEVMAQLLACDGLDALLKQANNGRGLRDFSILTFEIWHEWRFSPEGLRFHQPKWVMSTNTQSYLPSQKTPIPNLLLAGAHTKTDADIWSIEGAVESGRRAAQFLDADITVIPQYKSLWLRMLSFFDDLFYAVGAPHVLDVMFIVFIILMAFIIFS